MSIMTFTKNYQGLGKQSNKCQVKVNLKSNPQNYFNRKILNQFSNLCLIIT